jgi:FkbM family methyltransferase
LKLEAFEGGHPLFSRLWKPWFVYRPDRLIRRVVTAFRPPSRGYIPLQTSWGVRVIADPTRTIGQSILTTGVYDLAVSEALARLVSPGDTVVDAGANVGYMTVLASVAAGPSGKVVSIEPHARLFAVLQENIAAVRKQLNISRIELHNVALGDQPGTAELQLPPGFDSNDGIARIGQATPGGQSVTVPVEALDGVLGEGSAAVLKLDVEGYEAQVLRGSAHLLAGRRVRHIVFEDHAVDGSEVIRLLREAGYYLFSLGWSMRGLRIQPIEAGSLATKYEAPNFIGTLDPDEVLARCRPKGWLVLSGRITSRSA